MENSPGGNSPERPRAPNPFSGELLPRGRCRTGWWKSNSSGKHKIPPLTEQPHGLELTFVMSVSAPGMPEIPGQSRARAHHGERKWQIPLLLLQIQGHKNSITVPWSVRETLSAAERKASSHGTGPWAHNEPSNICIDFHQTLRAVRATPRHPLCFSCHLFPWSLGPNSLPVALISCPAALGELQRIRGLGRAQKGICHFWMLC